MSIGAVGNEAGYYGYGTVSRSGRANEKSPNTTVGTAAKETTSSNNGKTIGIMTVGNFGYLAKYADSSTPAEPIIKVGEHEVKINEVDPNNATRSGEGETEVESSIDDYLNDWDNNLECKKAEEFTEDDPVYEVTTTVNGETYTQKIHVNDVMSTKATQAEMYAFFEHYDSVNGTESSYEKFMVFMDTAKLHGYWDGNDTYAQFASDTHNWRDILPKVWGDAYSMGMYNVYNEGMGLSDPIEKAFISKIEFEPTKAASKPIETKVNFSWPDIPGELGEVLYAGFYSEKNEARFGEGLEGADNLFQLEFRIRNRIANQIDADGTRNSVGMWDSAISVLESMCEELDSYFGDKLGSLDSVKDEIAGLKEMYQSVIDDLKAAKEAALKESESEQSEDSYFRQMLTEYMASMIEKIKNGEIDQEFRIGSISLTLEEWDELIDKFDDLEEEMREAVKAEIKKQVEAERAAKTTKTDDSIDNTTLLSSEIRKTVFREATDIKPELSYITCFTSEGIICKETDMGENEYLWKMDFENEQDYEKVMDLVNSFQEDWNLKFAPNEKFWKDYLSERIDKDDFVSNLNQYSDKGKMNYLIERDGNTYINREAAKYCNYMNNPKDRIYNLQEFTELITNEIKENQKKLVAPNDEEALKRIDEQMEAFKCQMLGAAYNKVYHDDYYSNNYIWRADNTDELFRIFSRDGELISTIKYFDLMKLDDDTLASEYGFNEELLKTLSYVRAEK